MSVAASTTIAHVQTGGGTTYDVLHRITTVGDTSSTSSSSTTAWTRRATLSVSSTNHTLTNVLSNDEVKMLYSQAWDSASLDLLYQIGLRPHGDDQTALYTSVRLCHLRQSHRELRSIDDELLLSSRGADVVGLGYRVKDITLGSDHCPILSNVKLDKVKEERRKQRQRQLSRRRKSASSPSAASATIEQEFKLNTVVRSVTRQTPRKLMLKQAAPTNADGTVSVPPPEKTFVQKYWMYAIPLVLLLIMPDGHDDRDTGAEAHPSSEHPGSGKGAKRLS